MEKIKTLEDFRSSEANILTPALSELYDGGLSFPDPQVDRPYIIANYAVSMDGHITFNVAGKEGGEHISGYSKEDRFVMGILRASSDAVLIGGKVIGRVPNSLWTAGSISPDHADMYAEFREKLGKSKNPITVIFSGSGDLSPDAKVFNTPDVETIIFTTKNGEKVIKKKFRGRDVPETVTSAEDDAGKYVDTRKALEELRKRDIALLLVEAGNIITAPMFLGKMVDEIFNLNAHQIIGSSKENPRLSFSSGVAAKVGKGEWGDRVSIKTCGRKKMFTRYALDV